MVVWNCSCCCAISERRIRFKNSGNCQRNLWKSFHKNRFLELHFKAGRNLHQRHRRRLPPRSYTQFFSFGNKYDVIKKYGFNVVSKILICKQKFTGTIFMKQIITFCWTMSFPFNDTYLECEMVLASHHLHEKNSHSFQTSKPKYSQRYFAMSGSSAFWTVGTWAFRLDGP